MKKLFTIFLIPIFMGLGIWGFLEGRKEMQKEREREKPVETAPRFKKEADGSSVIEFDQETLRLSGVNSKVITGALEVNSTVMADGSEWYFSETEPGIFHRKRCVSNGCAVSNEKVVVQGTQVLLSEERKGIIRIGEDGGGSK